MATTKEIKKRIKSITDTQKITNAMYLIASTKLRKAKGELDQTRPFFTALQEEIKRIFRISEAVESKFFYPSSGEHDLPGSYGYLVITADKGLAGAYNQNVIKKATELMQQHHDPKLFVVGEYGRHYFASRNIPIEQSFLYTAQNPTISRARVISNILLERFSRGELRKIFVIYTDMHGAAEEEACAARLLPFHRADFSSEEQEHTEFEFVPSIETVLDHVVPSYVTGFIYSALIDSFCSEQSARMNSMDAANRNAQKLLDELSLQYNHIRQSAITQEITEVAAGARGMKQAKQNPSKGGANRG